MGHAQEAIQDTTKEMVAPDSLVHAVLTVADSSFVPFVNIEKQTYKPNSNRAVLWALIPGMGQVYNKQYWKLPIVYGLFMGCMYAITCNGKNYEDYWGAYQSIMHDAEVYNRLVQEAGGGEVDYDFNTKWTDFMATTDYKAAVNNVSYQNLFKRRKDFFRRNRDLSIILTAGTYLISMVDAYVDAELFDFDISPNLSMRVEPMLSLPTRYSSSSIGINCSVTF
jgi:hypothetical protein